MRTSLSIALVAMAVGLAPAMTQASGFQLWEQNASGLGSAYAGSAALADNASTIYFNPAGMVFLPGRNASAGLNAVRPSFKFRDNGNTRTPLALGGMRPTGGNGGDAGDLGLVPNAYLSWQLTDRWFAGVGFGAPFGLKTEYDDGWVGQYHSKLFDVQTVNINPSVAYRVNERFSLGFGVNWQRIDAQYKKRTVVPIPALGTALPGNADLTMHGDAWGWNIGFMLEPNPDTRIGLSYRSKIRHTARGGTRVDGFLPGRSLFYQAEASVTLPDTVILSAAHQLNSRWQLLGDISWTGWSSISELRIQNAGGPTDTLPLHFRDTWRVAIGANYQFAPQWKWRVGVAFDQSPVHDPADRPTSLPDTNRWWISTGVQYQASKNTTIDVGYAFLYIRDTAIDSASGNPVANGRVAGSYDSHANILGIQLSTRF